MTRLLLLLTLMLALVALAGCSFQAKIGGDEPTSGPPTPPAVTESTPDETVPSPVGMEQVGKGYDEATKEVTEITSIFAPTDPEIHVNVLVGELTTGEKVTGTLIAKAVTDSEGTKIFDYQVASTELDAPGAESTFHFTFSAPDAGWPVGSYEVLLAKGGATFYTINLGVE